MRKKVSHKWTGIVIVIVIVIVTVTVIVIVIVTVIAIVATCAEKKASTAKFAYLL